MKSISILLAEKNGNTATFYALEIKTDDVQKTLKQVKNVINEAMIKLISDLLKRNKEYKEIMQYKNSTSWLLEPLKIFNPVITTGKSPNIKLHGTKLTLTTIYDLKQINKANAEFLIKVLNSL